MTVWFVTPAHRRYELTAVCLEQRRRVIDSLALRGIAAQCVVVADDENLDIAREKGFATVEQDNSGLGRKFNDGMEFAAREGAAWIVPIGSDSWVMENFFIGLHHRFVRTSRLYCAVTETRLAELSVRDGKGAGPYVFPRAVLEPSGFRPARDELMRYIDGSTVRGVTRSLGRPVPWSPTFDFNPYQYIGFRGTPTLTPYRRLMEKWGVREHSDPWRLLARHYPEDLVRAARKALKSRG